MDINKFISNLFDDDYEDKMFLKTEPCPWCRMKHSMRFVTVYYTHDDTYRSGDPNKHYGALECCNCNAHGPASDLDIHAAAEAWNKMAIICSSCEQLEKCGRYDMPDKCQYCRAKLGMKKRV